MDGIYALLAGVLIFQGVKSVDTLRRLRHLPAPGVVLSPGLFVVVGSWAKWLVKGDPDPEPDLDPEGDPDLVDGPPPVSTACACGTCGVCQRQARRGVTDTAPAHNRVYQAPRDRLRALRAAMAHRTIIPAPAVPRPTSARPLDVWVAQSLTAGARPADIIRDAAAKFGASASTTKRAIRYVREVKP